MVDDIILEMKDSNLSTELDLKDDHWHVKLTEESSYFTTAKKCMKKCEISGYDFDLALLVLRPTVFFEHSVFQSEARICLSFSQIQPQNMLKMRLSII